MQVFWGLVLDLRFPGYFAFSWGWYNIGLRVWILVVVKHVTWQDLVFARLGSAGWCGFAI